MPLGICASQLNIPLDRDLSWPALSLVVQDGVQLPWKSVYVDEVCGMYTGALTERTLADRERASDPVVSSDDTRPLYHYARCLLYHARALQKLSSCRAQGREPCALCAPPKKQRALCCSSFVKD